MAFIIALRNIETLKSRQEFSRVYNARRSLADYNLILFQAEGTGKVGFVCSRKIGNSVVRHRFVRLAREAYRLHKDEIRKDRDIIIMARENAKGQGFTAIEASFIGLLKRHSIYVEKTAE